MPPISVPPTTWFTQRWLFVGFVDTAYIPDEVRLYLTPYRVVERLVWRGQDGPGVVTLLESKLGRDFGSAMCLIHVMCRLGMHEFAPTVERVLSFAKPNQSVNYIRRWYTKETVSGRLMAGDSDCLNNLSEGDIHYACYGFKFETVSKVLRDRALTTSRMSDMIYYAAVGKHNEVMKHKPCTIEEDSMYIFYDAMQDAFSKRDWRVASWETEQEAGQVVEFFRGMGLSYQQITPYAAQDALSLAYVAKKEIDYDKLLDDNYEMWVIYPLVRSGLVKWADIREDILGNWSWERQPLLRYLLKNGIETQQALIDRMFAPWRGGHLVKSILDVVDPSRLREIRDRALKEDAAGVLNALKVRESRRARSRKTTAQNQTDDAAVAKRQRTW